MKIYLSLLLFISFLNTSKTTFEISKLEFSTAEMDEMNPIIYKNGLIFSQFDRKGIRSRFNKKLKIYYIENDGEIWNEPVEIEFEEEIPFNLTPSHYVEKTKEIYFTGANLPDNDTLKLAIYKGTIDEFEITDLEILSFCERTNNYIYPTVSPNGLKMICSSDLNQNMDLYLYERDDIDSHWLFKRKLNEISSKGNDSYPMWIDEYRVYFSSNGFGESGTFDIFETYFENGYFSEPFNIEELNSSFDDFSRTENKNGQIFFCSTREGSVDIYFSNSN